MSQAAAFDDSRDLYQNIVLDRARNPRHQHMLEPFDASGHGDNPLCGDRIDVRVTYAPDGTVADAAFDARGCAISIASADLMAEIVRGRDPAGIRTLAAQFDELVHGREAQSHDSTIEMLRPLSGVSEYRSRIKCATLPWSALIAALDGKE